MSNRGRGSNFRGNSRGNSRGGRQHPSRPNPGPTQGSQGSQGNVYQSPTNFIKAKQETIQSNQSNKTFPHVEDDREYGILRSKFGDAGTSSEIITNHLAVNKIPSKLFEYQIFYADIPNPNPPASPHVIRQLAEKRRIFDVLGSMDPLATIGWGTDFDFLWTTKDICEPDATRRVVLNITYLKQSGEPRTIEQVTFSKYRTLDLTGQHLALIERPLASTTTTPLIVNPNANPNASPALRIRALNAIITRFMRSNGAVRVGPNKFFVTTGTSVGNLLDSPFATMRGYFTSIRPGLDQTLLNVNTCTSAFFRPILVSEYIAYMTDPDGGDMNIDGVAAQLKNVRVQITYDRRRQPGSLVDPNVHPTRVIAELGQALSAQRFFRRPNSTPPPDSNGYSVLDYYQQEWNSKFSNAELGTLCVNVGLNSRHLHERIWIPAFFLKIEPNQIFKHLLPSAVADAMIHIATRKPHLNARSIADEGLDMLGLRDAQVQQNLDKLPFHVDKRLISLNGRFLEKPELQFSNSFAGEVADNGAWRITQSTKGFPPMPFAYNPKKPPQKTLHIIRTHRNPGNVTDQKVQNAGDAFAGRIHLHGVDIAQTALVCPTVLAGAGRFTAELFKSYLDSVFPQGKSSGFPPMLIVIREKDQNLYAAVKSTTDRLGIVAVCVMSSKFLQCVNAVIDLIALKFCVKMKGEPHHIRKSALGAILLPHQDAGGPSGVVMTLPNPNPGNSAFVPKRFLQSENKMTYSLDASGKCVPIPHYNVPAGLAPQTNTIVFGADVTHPPKSGIKGLPSIAGVVASIDGNFMTYPASLRLQAGKQERISALKDMVSEHIKRWYNLNGHCQTLQILFYRDGVSSTQYDDLRAHEVPAVHAGWRAAFSAVFPTHDIDTHTLNLTFLIVTKRHHTRFYPKDLQKQSYPPPNYHNGNIKPGLVVDTVLTHPYNSDFYLLSHGALQGTACPSHYYPLVNHIPALQDPDTLQNVTHALCYAFPRATTAVSYVGPAYLADRACERGRVYLRDVYTGVRAMPGPGLMNGEVDQAFSVRKARELQRDDLWMGRHGGTNPNPWNDCLVDTMFYL
ncbi:Piwi-domain-containing protein [Aulographum hederae CBS 113979]|uniref:Piwi-domain-containing protein n=1 Tax=Aulographum hederae CBS 113979 TaxID=1176131 RepID=A0A6G1GQH8_9PEZI|nr:Piwi-domain-containing protein [Aulographum hederae CBS 113979]